MKAETLIELLRLDPPSNHRITKLEVLLDRGPSTPAEIAEEAGCRPPNVLSVFYRLARYGIVSSEPTPSLSPRGRPTSIWTAADANGTKDEQLVMLMNRCPQTQRTMQQIELLFYRPMTAFEIAPELGISKQMTHLRCQRMFKAGILGTKIDNAITYYVNHKDAVKPVITNPRISQRANKIALGAWV
ncbi:MAG: hypothetical protein ACQKBW_04420 [Puniceicoccales bacterium]